MAPYCPYFTGYLRLGSKRNNGGEVMKVKQFLNVHMGSELTKSELFDEKLDDAVRELQSRYRDRVLTPWGLESPTGYVYQSTRNMLNELAGCDEGEVRLDNGVVIN